MGDQRRRKGSGSLFLRGDGLWVGRAETDGVRTQASARLFCHALRRFSDMHPYRPEFSTPPIPRQVAMRAARELGRHTPAEWFALVRSVKSQCFYCGITCGPFNPRWARMTKDHRTPVSRGGSDAIENIFVACKRCNSEKANMTEDEFRTLWSPRRPASAS